MALSFKEVAEIVKIIDASNCEELVLESDGMRLAIRRGGTSGAVVGPSAGSTDFTAPSQLTGGKEITQPPAGKASGVSPGQTGSTPGVAIENAPMVGTFYRRPSPEAPPFVEVGSIVSPGDPLCVIEVMKLFTTISASVGGVVEAILVDDAILVEFDQPLFNIRLA